MAQQKQDRNEDRPQPASSREDLPQLLAQLSTGDPAFSELAKISTSLRRELREARDLLHNAAPAEHTPEALADITGSVQNKIERIATEAGELAGKVDHKILVLPNGELIVREDLEWLDDLFCKQHPLVGNETDAVERVCKLFPHVWFKNGRISRVELPDLAWLPSPKTAGLEDFLRSVKVTVNLGEEDKKVIAGVQGDNLIFEGIIGGALGRFLRRIRPSGISGHEIAEQKAHQGLLATRRQNETHLEVIKRATNSLRSAGKNLRGKDLLCRPESIS